jgi:hypothetical protein
MLCVLQIKTCWKLYEGHIFSTRIKNNKFDEMSKGFIRVGQNISLETFNCIIKNFPRNFCSQGFHPKFCC